MNKKFIRKFEHAETLVEKWLKQKRYSIVYSHGGKPHLLEYSKWSHFGDNASKTLHKKKFKSR